MPSSSHSPSPSSLTFNMRSRSLSPLSGSETLPFRSEGQWCERGETADENTILLDYQDHKGICFLILEFDHILWSREGRYWTYIFGPNVAYIQVLTWPIIFINRHCMRALEDGGFGVRVKLSEWVRQREFPEKGSFISCGGTEPKAHLPNLLSSLGRWRAYLFTSEWSALIQYKNVIHLWAIPVCLLANC